MAAAGALTLWDAPVRFAFAAVPTDRRLVVVILRGALDGLAAVPPHGDKDYAGVRGDLALDVGMATGRCTISMAFSGCIRPSPT